MMNETNPAQTRRPVLLWSVLVFSVVANAASSIAGLSSYVSIAFGALTFMCGMALFVRNR